MALLMQFTLPWFDLHAHLFSAHTIHNLSPHFNAAVLPIAFILITLVCFGFLSHL